MHRGNTLERFVCLHFEYELTFGDSYIYYTAVQTHTIIARYAARSLAIARAHHTLTQRVVYSEK